MEFDHIASLVEGVPYMTREQGEALYAHVRRTRPTDLLDLGTAHGVSAAYMAAALAANGDGGHVTTVDSHQAHFRDPAPEDLLERAGLAEHVTVVRRYSTYNWFLKERIAAQSDDAGNCTPAYDFCYLDGSKNWTVDGCAVFLAEKLLRPNGWLLLDDLDWTYGEVEGVESDWVDIRVMTPEERAEPHLRAVFELIVKQHPSFTEFRVQDGWWGWARKAPGEPRRYSLETTRSMTSMVVAGLRWLKRRIAYRTQKLEQR